MTVMIQSPTTAAQIYNKSKLWFNGYNRSCESKWWERYCHVQHVHFRLYMMKRVNKWQTKCCTGLIKPYTTTN